MYVVTYDILGQHGGQ